MIVMLVSIVLFAPVHRVPGMGYGAGKEEKLVCVFPSMSRPTFLLLSLENICKTIG